MYRIKAEIEDFKNTKYSAISIPARTNWRVRDLKEYVEKSFNFAVEDQNWIAGGTLPMDNELLIKVLEPFQLGKAKTHLSTSRIYRTILYLTPYAKERALPQALQPSSFNLNSIALSMPSDAGALHCSFL